MALAPRRFVAVTKAVAAIAMTLACTQKEAPKLEPAAPPPPPPPAPIVRDAAPDAVADAATDAGDARGPAKKRSAPEGSGGGGGGLKVAGSLSRADADKVVRGAQGKLRACFEQANAKGAGAKGRVSFKMTVDDRGRVTLAEIPTSSLSGGSDVEMCMVHVLRDLHFPRTGGESTLSFQMSFGR